MADSSHSGEHHGPTFNGYMLIALLLAICTISSFGINGAVRGESLGRVAGFLLILGVAVIKAVMVGMYFMHLKWDWKLLYFLIIPAFILGAMMMVVLLPDIVIGTSREAAEAIQIASESP